MLPTEKRAARVLGALTRAPRARLGEQWSQFVGLVRAAMFYLAVLACRVLRVRFVVNTWSPRQFRHIGHLASEPDCYVKEGILGRRPRYNGVLIYPRAEAANPCLLDYFRQQLWVVSSPFWVRLLSPLAEVPSLRYTTNDYVIAMNDTATFGAIQAAYGRRPPLFRLRKRHRRAGEERLRRMGLPPGAWFVCFHCREAGYNGYRPSEDARARGRNVRVQDYRLAMQAVVERGGWCVRVGDPAMTPLEPMPGVIDYAHSPLRCDWMDVFLCASARFTVGTASGLANLSNIFGVPCAITNQAMPLMTLPYGATDLFIPKLLRALGTGAHLTLAELLDGPLGNARFQHCLELGGVVLEDNTPEDIRDLTVEMFDELAGTFAVTAEDRRFEARYRALFRPGHYTYGAASRLGRVFLRKHRWLLDAPAQTCPRDDEAAAVCATPRCPCLRDPHWGARLMCKAPPPACVDSFPAGVADPALKQSGVYEDGWTAGAAHCVLTHPAGTEFALRGMFPQIGPRPVASEVRVLIDGHEALRKVLLPGAVDLTCPVPPGEGTRRVEVQFSVTQRLPAPDTRTVGMHLTFLGFRPAAGARAG